MEDSLRIEQEVKDKYDDDVIDRKVCVVTDGLDIPEGGDMRRHWRIAL